MMFSWQFHVSITHALTWSFFSCLVRVVAVFFFSARASVRSETLFSKASFSSVFTRPCKWDIFLSSIWIWKSWTRATTINLNAQINNNIILVISLFSCLVKKDSLLFQRILVQFAESAVQVGKSGPGAMDLSYGALLFIVKLLQFLILLEHDLSLPEQLSIDFLHTFFQTKPNSLK